MLIILELRMVQVDVDKLDSMRTMMANILVQLMYHDYVRSMDFERINDLNRYIYEMQLFAELLENRLSIDVDLKLFDVNNDEVNDEYYREELYLTKIDSYELK